MSVRAHHALVVGWRDLTITDTETGSSIWVSLRQVAEGAVHDEVDYLQCGPTTFA